VPTTLSMLSCRGRQRRGIFGRLRGFDFLGVDGYLANDHGFGRPIAIRIFIVVANRQRQDLAGNSQSLSHLPKDRVLSIHEGTPAEGNIELASGSVFAFAMAGADRSFLMGNLRMELRFHPVADTAVA